MFHRADTLSEFARIVGDQVLPLRVLEQYRMMRHAYHNEVHVFEMLRALYAYEQSFGRVAFHDALVLAIWFHDVVYDTKAKDNEEQSAVFAAHEISKCGLSQTLAVEVQRLIRATATHKATDEAEALMISLDLWVLGAPRSRYLTYAESIRKEYAWVALADYRQGRRAVLEHFLGRTMIFPVPYFAERFEVQARANMRAELLQL